MAIEDFRIFAEFTQPRVSQSGKIIGSRVYWKLYAVENLLRVLIDSILSINSPEPNLWEGNVILRNDQLERIEKEKEKQRALKWKSTRGEHPLYYLSLKELGKIIRDTEVSLVPPLAPDDREALIQDIEKIVHSRNVVAHMNFPSKDDESIINNLYRKIVSLIRRLEDSVKFKAPK